MKRQIKRAEMERQRERERERERAVFITHEVFSPNAVRQLDKPPTPKIE